MLLPSWVYAQDVEGVEIDSVMTYAQVVAKFGQPDEVKVQEADFPEGSKIYRYHYGSNYLIFSDVDGMIGFAIQDNRFAVITNYLEGGLRVGDPLSKVQNVDIKGYLEKRKEWPKYTSYNLFSQTDCPLWIREKDGIIVSMDLSIPM